MFAAAKIFKKYLNEYLLNQIDVFLFKFKCSYISKCEEMEIQSLMTF